MSLDLYDANSLSLCRKLFNAKLTIFINRWVVTDHLMSSHTRPSFDMPSLPLASSSLIPFQFLKRCQTPAAFNSSHALVSSLAIYTQLCRSSSMDPPFSTQLRTLTPHSAYHHDFTAQCHGSHSQLNALEHLMKPIYCC